MREEGEVLTPPLRSRYFARTTYSMLDVDGLWHSRTDGNMGANVLEVANESNICKYLFYRENECTG